MGSPQKTVYESGLAVVDVGDEGLDLVFHGIGQLEALGVDTQKKFVLLEIS